MENLKERLLLEIEEFRKVGHKFVNGEMSVIDFKHESGGMGAYAHRGGKEFMLRLRIPSGIITMPQLKMIYDWAEKYKLGGLHFTTRQSIQYHGLSIDEVCDLMKEALDKNIYTRGAGGNFPRNVALSPLSGVDKEEAFDPTPYAVATGEYFMERITSYKLPRKLKVSFSNGSNDTAHCTIQDLGFLAVNKDDKEYFRVYLGGGLGRNPKIALVYPELIEPREVLNYVEAMVRLFKAEGNYENKAKARVRYMVDKLGEEVFINEYKKYVEIVKKEENYKLSVETKKYTKTGIETNIANSRLVEQKQPGLYSVYVHPVGGQINISDLKTIISTLEKFDNPEIRLSMTEGIYFRNLNGKEAEEILEVTKSIGGTTSFDYSVACIGVPTCQIGICESQGALKETLNYVKENVSNIDLLPRLYFSGCPNSCGLHEIAQIGFTGKKKRINNVVEEVYEIHINGSFVEGEVRLGKCYGDIAKKDIPMFICELANNLNSANKSFIEYIKNNDSEFNALVEKYNC